MLSDLLAIALPGERECSDRVGIVPVADSTDLN